MNCPMLAARLSATRVSIELHAAPVAPLFARKDGVSNFLLHDLSQHVKNKSKRGEK